MNPGTDRRMQPLRPGSRKAIGKTAIGGLEYDWVLPGADSFGAVVEHVFATIAALNVERSMHDSDG